MGLWEICSRIVLTQDFLLGFSSKRDADSRALRMQCSSLKFAAEICLEFRALAVERF